jgi:hypothetical protein
LLFALAYEMLHFLLGTSYALTFSWFAFLVIILVYGVLLTLFKRYGRRFIRIGMTIVFIVPVIFALIVFGACLFYGTNGL